jgi:hypothetical protein
MLRLIFLLRFLFLRWLLLLRFLLLRWLLLRFLLPLLGGGGLGWAIAEGVQNKRREYNASPIKHIQEKENIPENISKSKNAVQEKPANDRIAYASPNSK